MRRGRGIHHQIRRFGILFTGRIIQAEDVTICLVDLFTYVAHRVFLRIALWDERLAAECFERRSENACLGNDGRCALAWLRLDDVSDNWLTSLQVDIGFTVEYGANQDPTPPQ